MKDFKTLISPLSIPAHQPQLFSLADNSETDAIILDLANTVPAHHKAQARSEILNNLDNFKKPVYIRTNEYDTPWFEEDLKTVLLSTPSGIILPKTETSSQLKQIKKLVGKTIPIIGLIETVLGLSNLEGICNMKHIVQIAFGSLDYSKDINSSEDRNSLLHARSQIVFYSRLAQLPAPLDGVTRDIENYEQLLADCVYAKKLGFGGKLAINIGQVSSINSIFLK